MRRLMLLLLVMTAFPGSLWAQVPQRSEDRTAEAPHLALRQQASGDPILVVDYPWAVHTNASIEVRLLPSEERATTTWTPIFFLTNYLSPEALKGIYRCQDQGEQLPATATFGKEKIDFEILAQRNSLGRSAVSIRCESRWEGPRSGLRAIFWPLKEWAVDRRTLYLELPKKGFSDRSQIRVWFLRDTHILWSETIAWPGYPQKPATGEEPPKS